MNLGNLRLLLLLGDGVDGASIRAAFPPTAAIHIADLRDTAGRTPRLLEESDPDLVLVGCSAYSEPALHVIRDVAARRTGCPIVVLYQGNPNGFMDPAFEAGADDLIVLPRPPQDLVFSLEKVLVRRRGSGPAAGAMITVLGPKGGTGKTLTACNLAVALAERGKRPVIVDLDLQFGDVGLALGLRPTRTIYDLAVSGGTLDADKIDAYLVAHPSGTKALLAPVRPDQAAAVDISLLRKVFELLRGRYDFTIVDTPPAFSPEVIAAVDASTHLCVVGMLDALSLKDTKIGFETLAQMGYDPEEIDLVLNRADTNVGIGQHDVEHLLGKAPDVMVPSDRAIPRGITDGRVIVETDPRGGPAQALKGLADRYVRLTGETAPEHTAPEPAVSTERRRALLRRR